jgi:hypothetical protein
MSRGPALTPWWRPLSTRLAFVIPSAREDGVNWSSTTVWRAFVSDADTVGLL